MAPRPPIQTSQQLGVSNVRLLLRGLLVRCPACGSGHTHQPFWTIRDRCQECSLKFERIEGHAIGYIGINTIVTFGLTFVVILVGAIATKPDIAMWPLTIAAMSTAALVPTCFLRSSRTVWTAIDLIMRPLRPGEIDPRFIVVDPTVGRWKR